MFRTTQPRRGVTDAPLRRRVVGAIAALTLGVSVLSGCAAGQISQTADQVPNQDGAEGTVGVVGVRNFIIAGPTSDQKGGTGGVALAEGDTATLQFWLTNDSNDKSDKLTAINTPAGSVSISGDTTIAPQGFLQVGGSNSAVTATVKLTEPLKYGVSVPFTFSFATAGDVSMNATVAIPKERAADRATTDIYPAEPTNLWGD